MLAYMNLTPQRYLLMFPGALMDLSKQKKPRLGRGFGAPVNSKMAGTAGKPSFF